MHDSGLFIVVVVAFGCLIVLCLLYSTSTNSVIHDSMFMCINKLWLTVWISAGLSYVFYVSHCFSFQPEGLLFFEDSIDWLLPELL